MKKIFIFIILIAALNAYTSEKKSISNSFDFCFDKQENIYEPFNLFSSFSNYNNLNLDSVNYSDPFSKINSKGFITAGIALTATGGALLLGGGTLIGLSYYFSWIGLTYVLETTDFSVKDWNIVWDVMFLSANKYSQCALAVSSLFAGINLLGAGLMIIPGIIYLVIGLVAKKKLSAYNITPLSNSFGISIKF
jgi:hypothetical protein